MTKILKRISIATSILILLLSGCSNGGDSVNEQLPIINVPAQPATLTGISLDTTLVKKTYYQNEKLNLSGLKVIATYSDTSTKEVKDYTTSLADGSSLENAGDKTITISYSGKSTSFNISVVALEVTAIELDTTSVKKTYYRNEKLNLSGLKVIATYNDSSTKEISDFTTSLTDGSTLEIAGNHTVTITYGSMTKSFDVTVDELEVTSIELDTSSVKMNYYQYDALDLSNLKVTAKFNDGSSKEVTDFTTSLTDGSTLEIAGNHTITITYAGMTKSFDVTVDELEVTSIELDTSSVKKNYYQYESLDLSKLKVTATFNNESSKEATDFTTSIIHGTVLDSAGTKNITVTYCNKTASFGINVTEVLVDTIELDTSLLNLEFYQYSTLNLTGLKVLAKYNNGTSSSVTDYTTSPNADSILSTLGKNTITVSYEGKSADFEITVKKNYISGISISMPAYSDVQNLLTENSGTFTAKTGFSAYEWWCDGTKLGISAAQITLSDLSGRRGYHELMLIATDAEGNKYSATATFFIEQ